MAKDEDNRASPAYGKLKRVAKAATVKAKNAEVDAYRWEAGCATGREFCHPTGQAMELALTFEWLRR